jgi:hypothetical protein
LVDIFPPFQKTMVTVFSLLMWNSFAHDQCDRSSSALCISWWRLDTITISSAYM